MMLRFAPLLLLLLAHPCAASAQMPTYPAYTTPTECTNGTGTPIATVATSGTKLCSAAIAPTRSYAQVAANGGTAGTAALACTWDGTTPSATHFNFPVLGNATWDTSAMETVPQGAIACASLTGSSVGVTATVVQSGAGASP